MFKKLFWIIVFVSPVLLFAQSSTPIMSGSEVRALERNAILNKIINRRAKIMSTTNGKCSGVTPDDIRQLTDMNLAADVLPHIQVIIEMLEQDMKRDTENTNNLTDSK